MSKYNNPAIARAMNCIQTAAGKIGSDPSRPVYHLHPPAYWMNDPNGTIFYKGYYHVFYQHNPYGDTWAHIHWGHARSKDLVHWKHLPIAIWPSEEKGEAQCFSGCLHINKKGVPIIYYTKVPTKPEKTPREQWAAIGDDDLINWEKYAGNPILDLKNHGEVKFKWNWRDPFIFEEQGRTFMVLGAMLDEKNGDPVIPIYEAGDEDLLKWIYRSIFFRGSNSEKRFFECPNFFKIGQKWVLLFSPYMPVEYYIGSFNLEALTFMPETHGHLDHSTEYYATNVSFDDKGRCILFSWIRGFLKGRGWNGCLALPRVLSLDDRGILTQKAVAELKRLRNRHFTFSNINLDHNRFFLKDVAGDTLEIFATFKPLNMHTFGIKVRRSNDGKKAIAIRFDGRILDAAGTKVPLELTEDNKALNLHIFLDKSVMEVFANDGRICITRVIYPGEGDLGIELFSEGGKTLVSALDVWTMNPGTGGLIHSTK